MVGLFDEFENANSLRSYPFAEGCVQDDASDGFIPSDVFIDAMIYPVNPSGTVYLSGVSSDGVFSISDDTGVIMNGEISDDRVEFHDLSDLNRHVGMLIASSAERLSAFALSGSDRVYTSSTAAFAASCVFPVVIDGVVSLSVSGSTRVDGMVSFANSKTDIVRVSSTELDDGRKTLRFDVLPVRSVSSENAIRRIVCVVDGQTPFRISKIADNIIMLTLDNVDRSVVCSAAHRENQFEMADTCDCSKESLPSESALEDVYQLEEVFIPPDEGDGHPEGGISEGMDNAFYLVSPNVLGYVNPISITLEDGTVSPRTEDVETVVNGTSIEIAEGELQDRVTSKAVVIQVPGLSGGEI